jgi:hypothetical protein
MNKRTEKKKRIDDIKSISNFCNTVANKAFSIFFLSNKKGVIINKQPATLTVCKLN